MDFVVAIVAVALVAGLVYWQAGDRVKAFFDKYL